MSKKGIKIKALAQELGITSRQLLDRCREADLPVQNSVTRISSETERTIRQWFESGGGSPAPPDDSEEG